MMKTGKSVEEINRKLKQGKAVVLTAEEVKKMAKAEGVKTVARKVDVVTTATFGAMCSSGVFMNFGHSTPPIKMTKVWLNDVPCCAGLAAVDAYLGATDVSERNPEYGGAHVIEDLIAGKDIKLKAIGRGTDCYPRREIETYVNKKSINECFLFNPRNAYQNYAAATNSQERTIYTYMGILLPNFGNATYATTGELSPLLNDPELRTIGIGTRIFLGGAQGFIAWNGTQFNTTQPRSRNRIPLKPSATLSLIGDVKKMSREFIRAAVFERYGVSLYVGIGVPIPVLDEEIARFVSVQDREIHTFVYDYGLPSHPIVAKVNYADLKSGSIRLKGREVKTAPMSSVYKARKIAGILKKWLEKGIFTVSQPVQELPRNAALRKLAIREVK
jgi:uncharacterized protein (DUF39 family)